MAITIKVKRGLKANLPTSASVGELLLATDTRELFKGTGTAVEAIRLDLANVIGLLSGGKIDSNLLPPLAITEVHVVADIAARDALTVQEGDVAVVTNARADPSVNSDLTVSYIYDGAQWVRMQAVGAVSSVNGATGAVVLDTDDIGEGMTHLYYTDARVAAYLAANAYLNDGDDAARLGSGSAPESALLEANGAGGTRWATALDGGTF
jgi:hypothetical protein